MHDRLLALVLATTGCGEASAVGADAGAADASIDAKLDSRASHADGSGDADAAGHALGQIGDPCEADSDCGEGAHPICFVDHVNGLSAANTARGYCSSACGKHTADCGVGSAVCMWFGFTDQPYCFHPCNEAADCRQGYVCFEWMAPVCFPSQPFLDCDPGAGDGGCTTSDGQPGGRYRLASGSGLAGRCGARCDIGAGHCRPDPSGAALRCRPVNGTLESDGGPTGDRWQGPVCDILASSPDRFGSCIFAGSKPPRNYATLCADGLDCAAQFNPFGDDDCLPLCYLDGGAPSGGGAVLGCGPDGGCRDVYRLAAAPDPSARVGLCPMGP